jgi:hypothetical protein
LNATVWLGLACEIGLSNADSAPVIYGKAF